MGKETIQELSAAVLVELQRLGYAATTIEFYDRMYRKLTRYAKENRIQHYSIDVSERWLKESLGIDPGLVVREKEGAYKPKFYYPIRACQCLTEWQIHGCLALKRPGKLASLEVPSQFKEGFESYTVFCRDAEYSERGTYTRVNRIKRMLLFFDQHGVSSFHDITGRAISAFFGTQIELDSRTVATMLSSCRVFFRHLYRMGFTHNNLTKKLPVVKANRQFKLPKVWRQEDVLTVLNSIDRGNPVVKRDYAILMLITRYGLRSVDVKTMKLSDIRWKEKVIEIVQNKTRNVLRLPLLHDVGWALIDYLKHGRPPSEHSEVFLTCTVPIRPFGTHSNGLNSILAKRVQQAGVRIPRDVPTGMHSLRHTLASVMLAHDIELPVISSVLGHITSEATGIYLHVDLARLRECVLDPEEVLSHEAE
ncbi:MAG: site-specific integrase [Spirochaetota bacterium]